MINKIDKLAPLKKILFFNSVRLQLDPLNPNQSKLLNNVTLQQFYTKV